MGQHMVRKLIRSKMSHPNARDLPLCHTINLTAYFLASCTKLELQDRYTEILETCASRAAMYWRLIECITTKKSEPIQDKAVMENALIAAIEANEMPLVEQLLNNGVSAASNTPFFGEALATAVSSGSLALVQLLLDRWDWESYKQLNGFRIMHAIEAAAATGREDMVTKLLDYKDLITPSTYDDAIMDMVRKNDWVNANRLLDLRQTGRSPPSATRKLWSGLIRSVAIYDRQDFLQHTVARILPNVQEADLGLAIKEASLKNHSKMIRILLSYFTTCNLTHHVHGLFYAARCDSMEALLLLLEFLKKDQDAIYVALAGAVSGKKTRIIQHLLGLIGVSIPDESLPTQFTDIIRSIIPDAFIPSEPPSSVEDSAPLQLENLYSACNEGKFADVIKIFGTIKSQHPGIDELIFSDALDIAINTSRPHVVSFLAENLTYYTINDHPESPATSQILLDAGKDGADYFREMM